MTKGGDGNGATGTVAAEVRHLMGAYDAQPQLMGGRPTFAMTNADGVVYLFFQSGLWAVAPELGSSSYKLAVTSTRCGRILLWAPGRHFTEACRTRGDIEAFCVAADESTAAKAAAVKAAAGRAQARLHRHRRRRRCPVAPSRRSCTARTN